MSLGIELFFSLNEIQQSNRHVLVVLALQHSSLFAVDSLARTSAQGACHHHAVVRGNPNRQQAAGNRQQGARSREQGRGSGEAGKRGCLLVRRSHNSP